MNAYLCVNLSIMRKTKQIVILLFLTVAFLYSGAQTNVADTNILVPMFSASYGYQLPGGDLAERFGSNSVIGGDFKLKLKSNWIIGAEFNYIFGEDVKNRDDVLRRIKTSDGEIIDGTGGFAAWQIFERGYYTSIKFGKLFPVFGPNPNSGIFITAGAGYFQHKIRIEVEQNTAPQLRDDYKRGYDRLTGGLATTQFVGYLYMGNSRIINFYAGFEFVQGWTKSLRDYNFDDMSYTDESRFDLLSGFKVGWFIPINRRAPEKFYYY